MERSSKGIERRSFLKTLAVVPFISYLPKTKNYGYISKPKSVKSLYEVSSLKNYGENKVVCLWKPWVSLNGPWIPRFQLVGDCVAQGLAADIDLLSAIQILLRNKKEKYVANSSVIAIYSGGRNLIAKSKIRSGMVPYWALDFLKEYGVLYQIPYPPYDLTKYTEEQIAYFDDNGLPESLLVEAKKHPLLSYAKVNSWEELRDGVAAGNPVLMGGYLGMERDERDKDGFIKPDKSWAHAVCVAGVQDGRRPGALVINSHGKNFGRGPKTFDQPDGSVWIDAKYIDEVCRDDGDSYVVSSFKGFQCPKVDYILF